MTDPATPERRKATRREADDRLAMALATARHGAITGIADLFNLDTAQRAEFRALVAGWKDPAPLVS